MKKLLAIVMVVAMMLSMSVIASADATADIAYDAEAKVATITVSDAQIQTVDFGVVYPESVSAKMPKWTDGWKDATQDLIDEGEYTVSGIGNKAATDEAGNSYAVYTAACMVTEDGSAIPYEGDILTFVFENVEEGTEFVVVSGTASAADVKANTVATLVAETPAPVETATPVPATQAPATQAPATQAPATQAPATQAPATDAPATQAPNNAGSTTAPKTADVAPVATMITLVVVAGLAIVALKKKATN